ncbi:hypothetical protein [Gordonia caeni]|uniref:Uncharacterized protein n=1 Tax=Gordonia caeni TaxID=1007097 RepID=A0ABP7NY94_9ACTN
MTLNRRISTGDLARVLAEIRAQLPPEYDPYHDYWAAPYDCDCCAAALDDVACPETFLPEDQHDAGHPPLPKLRRAG